MTHMIFMLAAVLFLIAGCCPERHAQTQPPPSGPTTRTIAAATNPSTRPLIVAAPNPPIAKLTPNRLALLSQQRKYLTTEGPQKRGVEFFKLCTGIWSVSREGPPMTELDVIQLLGAPDYGDSVPDSAWYVYLYDDRQGRKAGALFRFDAVGHLTDFGFNAAKAFDIDGLPKFKLP